MIAAQLGRELPLADEHEAERLGAQQLGRRQHDVGAVQRAPLAVLQHGQRLAVRRRPGRAVGARLRQRADRHHREAVARQPERLLVVGGVRPGVGEDQPRQAEGDLVDRPHGGGLGAAAAHQPAVAGKGVQQGDQRVEDEAGVTEGGEQPPERHEEVARDSRR